MKIPLLFSKYDTVNANAVVKVMIGERKEISVSFIIDTGCPFTFISLIPTEYNALSRSVGTKKYETLKWGNKQIKLLSLGGAEFTMQDKNGKTTIIKLKQLFLARIEEIPESVLGIDFLRNSGVRLFLDPKNDYAHFEK